MSMNGQGPSHPTPDPPFFSNMLYDSLEQNQEISSSGLRRGASDLGASFVTGGAESLAQWPNGSSTIYDPSLRISSLSDTSPTSRLNDIATTSTEHSAQPNMDPANNPFFWEDWSTSAVISGEIGGLPLFVRHLL